MTTGSAATTTSLPGRPEAALKVSEVAPEAPLMARENRKFLRRAVRYLGAKARRLSRTWIWT